MVTLADCQRVQHAWFRALAQADGGRAFSTHRMDWVWLPLQRQMVCLFPAEVGDAGLLPALAEARRRGAEAVGVWLNAAVREGILPGRGFVRGAQPWWMTAPVDAVLGAAGPGSAGRGWSSPGSAGDGRVTLLDIAPGRWLATAQVDGEWAGHATAHVAPEQAGTPLAGIFELEVAPEHRRTGVGSALLARLAAATAQAGAAHLTLNATPEGQLLFRARGFQTVGKGHTWWLELPR